MNWDDVAFMAREYGAKLGKRFLQRDLIIHNWRVLNGMYARRGLCGGICLMYLALVKQGRGVDGFLAEAAHGAGLAKFAEKAQQHITAGEMDLALAAFNLARASALIMCPDSNSVARMCVSSRSSMALIGLPNHWCAMGYEPDRYVFFDPNFGAFGFPDTLKFTLFLQQFLDLGPYGRGHMDVTWVR